MKETDKRRLRSMGLAQLKNGTGFSRLTVGTLPRRMKSLMTSARKYRTELEEVVLDVKGEISPTDAHLIDEAAGAELHAAVCRWLLRERLEKMSPQDIAKCSEQAFLKSKTTRNRAVERLGLDRDDANEAITALYEKIQ